MTEAIDVVVPALLDGVRVDRAICMLTGASRTEAARLVREGKVTVGDSVVSTRSTPLAEGSRLCVEGMVAADAPLLAEPDVSVDVVYDDDDVIVVNKQAGLVVHPGAGRTQGTLAAGLLARYPDLADLVASGTSDPERRASCTGSTAARRACSSSGAARWQWPACETNWRPGPWSGATSPSSTAR